MYCLGGRPGSVSVATYYRAGPDGSRDHESGGRMTGALRINALVLIARVLVRLWVRGFPALMRDFPAGRKANSADRGYFVKDAESLAGIKRIFVKLTGFVFRHVIILMRRAAARG
jgi:hypothetical protein